MTGCYVPNHRCIDNAIHTFAGVELRLACAKLMARQGCPGPTGQAKITPAFDLPCRYVLHTVGPIVDGRVTRRDRDLLTSCYRACLELAAENGQAAQIAVAMVSAFLKKQTSVRKVIFDVFKAKDRAVYTRLLGADQTAEGRTAGL